MSFTYSSKLFGGIGAGGSGVGTSLTTQVLFNASGAVAGDAGLTYDAATDTLTSGVFNVNAPASNQKVSAFSITSADPAAGPFNWTVQETTFNGQKDTVSLLGYNIGIGGGKFLATEPRLYFGIETDYLPGAVHKFETYLDYLNPSATIGYRLWHYEIDRNAATANTSLITAQLVGPLIIQQPDGTSIVAVNPGYVSISPHPTVGTGSLLKLFANATASSTFAMQFAAADAFSFLTQAPYKTSFRQKNTNDITVFNVVNNNIGPQVSFGSDADPDGVVTITSANQTFYNVVPTLSLIAHSGQTGPVLVVQDSVPAVRWAVTPGGHTLGSQSKALTDATPTAFATFPIADGATYGGKVTYSVVSTQGTATQRLDGEVRFSATREDTTYTAVVGTTHEALEQTLAAAAGTLTGGVTIACAAGVCTLSANFNTSQTPDAFALNYSIASPDAGLTVTSL